MSEGHDGDTTKHDFGYAEGDEEKEEAKRIPRRCIYESKIRRWKAVRRAGSHDELWHSTRSTLDERSHPRWPPSVTRCRPSHGHVGKPIGIQKLIERSTSLREIERNS
ncbi:hypothetical protein KPH14_011708 [Odynerus spinipes]|uniref:Uncharacterized protein n=1 Tax=Odynerus spinipes TaxID=1348599 RepID=A0AAD9RVE6_9HYME|nr:hypothetical protein KPH14_011708 [Odynerus spinipes]